MPSRRRHAPACQRPTRGEIGVIDVMADTPSKTMAGRAPEGSAETRFPEPVRGHILEAAPRPVDWGRRRETLGEVAEVAYAACRSTGIHHFQTRK